MALLDKYKELVESEADHPEKEELVLQICTMLTVHAQVEEEIFYPAARGVLEEQDLIDEADVEHASAKDLIAQIESASAGHDHYDAKVTVLGEYINHYVEVEEGEMFPKIKKADLDLAAPGGLLARKQELLVEPAWRRALPDRSSKKSGHLATPACPVCVSEVCSGRTT